MKTQTILISIFGTAFIASLLSVVSCDAANNSSALVGRWVGVFGDDKGVVMELLSDGTGISTINSIGVAITWKTEKDRFFLTASGTAQAAGYKLQGSELTFNEDDGKITKYTKCNKDCQAAAREYAKAEAEKAAAILKAKAKKSSFTDARDNKTYKTVKLDNQIWMAENLNYNANGSKCYENQESNCQKYGRLYNWSTANSACPSSWHLPSVDEWRILGDFVGGYEVAGLMLKASSGWNENVNGVDAVGFSALPGGCGYSRWWSSTGHVTYVGDGDKYNFNDLVHGSYYNKSSLLSVRCIQD